MSIRATARYAFGLIFARFMPLNDDLTIPVPSRIVGGAGPFDFSGAAHINAVPIIVKIDNNDPVAINVDLSGVVDNTAVTAEELRDAINLVAGPADVVASVNLTTGRLHLAYDESDVIGYLQIYGEGAEISLIGQGLGCRFITSDTLRSIGETPVVKDEEIITTTDAKGLDTSVITDGYRKGFTAPVVDTAEDWSLLALMEGGHYDPDTGVYEVPTSEDSKIYFYVEAYYARYTRGDNKESELISYVQKLHRSCKGAIGDKSHERGFADGNYTITGTSYKDENEILYGDTKLTELTIEDYDALDVYNV